MSQLIYHSDKRRVLPKIERVSDFQEKRALRSITKVEKNNQNLVEYKQDDLTVKLEEWKKEKSRSLAGDILSHAIVTDQIKYVEEVKKSLLNDKNDLISQWIFNREKPIINLNKQISNNKKKLIIEPKDAFTWVDQAINYFEKGQVEKSKKCLESALTINKDSSFIVRNASRLYSHFGDNGKSISILKKSKLYNYDPQILSAEIAFSQIENRKTRGIDIGRKLINNENYSYYQKSELSGAIGTLEYFEGNYKKSELLFDQSLIDPTENSFAQSLWYKIEPIPSQAFLQYMKSNEIQAHHHAMLDKFEESYIFAKGWINDEKFSIRPYKTASHIKGVIMEDYLEGFNIMQEGILKQRLIKGNAIGKEEEMDYMNDLAYFLLKSNRLEEAQKYTNSMMSVILKKGKLNEHEHVNLATLGLLAFRSGDSNLGRKLYRKSIEYFVKKNQLYNAGSAFLNYFEEEIRIEKNKDSLLKLEKELENLINYKSKNDLIYLKNKIIKKAHKKIDVLNG